ncbi:1-(5-phosphoribosyl)-5-[(5-phosphoribosylamino)methylideneamino] imidazole-4-carboxamide isomerase [Desulforamulus reducens MI-1]|uniref:1-(5-phosphoribosyl)-5-[(5-phosphoribosylamino)methylideneamino] imidazole-4-carboxamide isomerase n=1 Tax=Desulforamulus reducens (strain ATCC BAA-1160 / DSM 100696 / MI-1) TaxID=349161 RepID=HIS4_DESRM|nr:1-(5-phosphoribosyl)-5-[(5-phosphoribosylamino)methylideneamino]imidazole-4-carboxamide isomerase [Desulforamulus reducens]A4J708.1 RecName: Full=1-(5-phosphoribosyl)-5-[(5-phosphoribosylamino)methylideneamino] imidazole-4-carboxamide isomerase; AltName: Full=Phosphoribosylformimino-5-aminoimidazole carboxamide ribotide isomerase [Desulforamulus reducens MI-1]ABO50861.1 1-(5-phosphoribosyl)-5-[(5-phosphoribosylamino)methylideneamino] imidazole-4-carboxamide isomerase [Desulforamulus reducens M
MILFPAIDLKEGQCVRLVEGRMDSATVYSNDPGSMARLWQDQGAQYIHVVDLDGAFAGQPRNRQSIAQIVQGVQVPVQVGGGIRDLETIEDLLSLGVDRVILGSAAILKPELVAEACRKYGQRILLGIDAKDGQVAIQGWGETVKRTALDLALEMKQLGIERAVFTDIRRDGKLSGPNLAATGELARNSGLRVIASGGVASLEDIRQLKKLEQDGVEGAILGKALYTNAVKLPEALVIARGEESVC